MCSEDTEITEHYLIRCQLYADRREIVFKTVSSIIQNDVSNFQENDLCSLLLYDGPRLNEISNRSSLESTSGCPQKKNYKRLIDHRTNGLFNYQFCFWI